MDETNAKQAARLLVSRLPSWTVWYGEHTGHFWAVPRARDLAAAPHIESPTPAQLEHRAHEIERHFRSRDDVVRLPLARPVPLRSRTTETQS